MSALVGLCVVWLSGAIAASAPSTSTPPSCQDGATKQRAHEVGRRQGTSMVESAWASARRDCRELARVEQSIRDVLARRVPPDGASESLRCRYLGFRGGVEDALARIAAECAGK